MTPRFALLGLPPCALTALALWTGTATGGGGAAPPVGLHVGLMLAAGVAWALALLAIGRGFAPRRRSDALWLWAVALLLRAPAWATAPLHSDDVNRYAWDGRVARAGVNPYRYPPGAPELAALRGPPGSGAAGDATFAGINHRDLPTIYPPGAQLAFLLAASLPLPPVPALKLVLGAADLGVLALLLGWLRRRGDDPRWAAVWGWSPLAALELAGDAHLDALPLLGVVAALSVWESGRPARATLAGLAIGWAVAAKGLALPLLVGLRSRRAVLAAACVLALVSLPYLGAGSALAGSSGEFARRWRGNDGAFALVQWAASSATCAALHAPPTPPQLEAGPACARPLDLRAHPRLAAAITGRNDRATVYPDELAGLGARAVVAALLALLLLALFLARASPLAVAEWFLGALLLLTPALKPWYVLWLLPLSAVTRRPAWLALAVLAPLGYLAGALGPGDGRGAVWLRVVEHGACWALLAAGALRAAWRAATGAKLDPPAVPATIAAL